MNIIYCTHVESKTSYTGSTSKTSKTSRKRRQETSQRGNFASDADCEMKKEKTRHDTTEGSTSGSPTAQRARE